MVFLFFFFFEGGGGGDEKQRFINAHQGRKMPMNIQLLFTGKLYWQNDVSLSFIYLFICIFLFLGGKAIAGSYTSNRFSRVAFPDAS